jgi:hypothetical protein
MRLSLIGHYRVQDLIRSNLTFRDASIDGLTVDGLYRLNRSERSLHPVSAAPDRPNGSGDGPIGGSVVRREDHHPSFALPHAFDSLAVAPNQTIPSTVHAVTVLL